MAIQAIEGSIQLPIEKPTGLRRFPIEYLFPRLEPSEFERSFGPIFLRCRLREMETIFVIIRVNLGLLRKVLRRRKTARFLQRDVNVLHKKQATAHSEILEGAGQRTKMNAADPERGRGVSS